MEPIDSRFVRLGMKYITCTTKPCTKNQVIMLCEILSELHEQRKIIHGDIRKSNILFSNDCQSAYFIDFDLADHEDVPYPSNFNHIEERHKNALPYRPRRKEHDRYSL